MSMDDWVGIRWITFPPVKLNFFSEEPIYFLVIFWEKYVAPKKAGSPARDPEGLLRVLAAAGSAGDPHEDGRSEAQGLPSRVRKRRASGGHDRLRRRSPRALQVDE